MPRDSAGAYSLPTGTLVNSGDTVLPSQHNPFANDVAQSMTNSLSRDGLGGMRADLDMGGHKIANAEPGTADTDVATFSQVVSAGAPIGAVLDFAGSTAPLGFLLCFGQAISRTTYADLFAVIGTVFGTGDGSTTFNVPDLRGRVTAGQDNMGGTSAARLDNIASTTLGGSGGTKTHTLVTGEMPSHSHTVTDPGHTHTVPVSQSAAQYSSGTNLFGPVVQSANSNTSSATTGITLASTGGGGAHNNVQPTMILNKIVKVSN